MTSVTRPPEDLYVLGYTRYKGNVSGGCREVFLRDDEVVRRIEKIYGEYSNRVAHLTVHRLVRDHPEVPDFLVWRPVGVSLARPTTLVPPAPDASPSSRTYR